MVFNVMNIGSVTNIGLCNVGTKSYWLTPEWNIIYMTLVFFSAHPDTTVVWRIPIHARTTFAKQSVISQKNRCNNIINFRLDKTAVHTSNYTIHNVYYINLRELHALRAETDERVATRTFASPRNPISRHQRINHMFMKCTYKQLQRILCSALLNKGSASARARK